MRRGRRGWCAVAVFLLWAPSALAQEAGIAQFVPLADESDLFSKFDASPSPARTAYPAKTAVLDATLGRSLFPLPKSTRSFASHAEFAAFLQQSLNAMPIYDGAGKVIGARGWLLQIGRTHYLDASHAVQRVTDPIGAFIGGLQGKFGVAGATYTTGLQGEAASSPPARVLHCNPAGECIAGRSWNSHWIFNLRDSVGTEVSQESGGYQEDVHFCWKFGFIPWVCTSSSGSNLLTLQGALFYDSYEIYGYGPSYPVLAASLPLTTRANVTSMSFESWSYFFGGGGDGLSTASILIGACGSDGSAAVNSIGATAAGSVISGNCFGGGVACLSPYDTQCEIPMGFFGNLSVCTSLTADRNHCGACWNACASGWSCQGGTCVAPPPPPPPPPPAPCRTGYRDCGDGFCVKWPQQCP